MNTIQPQYSNNKTQVPFKSLKRIEMKKYFDPSKNLKDAKIYHAFKKSEPIKEFFEKYDGIVEFYKDRWLSSSCDEIRECLYMNIKFTCEKLEKNWLKRKVQNVKNFVLDSLSEKPYEKHTIEVNLFDEYSLGDIGQDLKNGVKEAKKAEQIKAQEHELINRLLNR